MGRIILLKLRGERLIVVILVIDVLYLVAAGLSPISLTRKRYLEKTYNTFIKGISKSIVTQFMTIKISGDKKRHTQYGYQTIPSTWFLYLVVYFEPDILYESCLIICLIFFKDLIYL